VKRIQATFERADERTAIYLLITFLAGWILVMLTIQGVQIAQNHVGLGLHQHVPRNIVQQIGVGNDFDQMMKATNKP
jgi:hypothetical protein